ncbi:MAG: hypothetical protein Q7S51_09765 [Gallionellaceae bacterium]|nr:hypothetical protein [Gallionellaceae bacterium]
MMQNKTVSEPGRFDTTVYTRELDAVLANGQEESCAALVDVSDEKNMVQRVQGTPPHAPLDAAQLGLLTRAVLMPDELSSVQRTELNVLISALGGLQAVVIPMSKEDIFALRLSGSNRVLILLIRHRDVTVIDAGTVARAQVVRSKVEQNKLELSPMEQSYSIWATLVNKLMELTRKAGMSLQLKGVLKDAIQGDEYVSAGILVDLAQRSVLDYYLIGAVDAAAVLKAVLPLFGGALDLYPLLAAMGYARHNSDNNSGNNSDNNIGKVQLQIGERDFYWLRVPYFPLLHLPFDPIAMLLLYKKPQGNPVLDWSVLDRAGLNLLRLRIGVLLEGGLQTMLEPFPRTHIEFQAILDELGRLDREDVISRLDIGGFAPRPVDIDGTIQRCQECIYYLPHRKWCDLPELPVPVEPDWWCRLWKV